MQFNPLLFLIVVGLIVLMIVFPITFSIALFIGASAAVGYVLFQPFAFNFVQSILPENLLVSSPSKEILGPGYIIHALVLIAIMIALGMHIFN